MRLPDLAGYRLEKLMGEDPFGWNFLAGKSATDKRLVRVLKSQATQDQSISEIYRQLLPMSGSSGIPAYEKFSRRMVGMPSAIISQFPGWQGKSGNWKLSAISRLLSMMQAGESGAMACCERLIFTLAELHQRRIVHGGIHPDNVFLTGSGDEPVVQFTGFGERVMPGLQHIEAAHLPFFLAPEQLLSAPPASTVAKWDVYAAGVVIFQLLTHSLPRLDRWHRQFQENPEPLNRVLLVANGSMTANAGKIYGLLEGERELVWPFQPRSTREKILREAAQFCLAFDPAHRPETMAEVRDWLLPLLQKAEAESQVSRPAQPAPASAPQPVAARNSQPVAARNSQPVALNPPPASAELSPAPVAPAPATFVPAPAAVMAAVAPAPAPVAPIPVVEQSVESALVPPPRQIAPASSIQPMRTEEAMAAVAPPANARKRPAPEIAEAKPGLIEKVPVLRRFKSASILDQAVGLLILLMVVSLSGATYWFKQQTDLTVQQKESELRELRSGFEAQAESLRKMLAEKQRSTQSIKENLDDVEDREAQLRSETKLARELLRQTQENGDHFFKLVLENADSDVPEFRKHRAAALLEGRAHYQRLIEIYGESHDFTASKADAYYYLGRINREMGDYEAAEEAFDEAEKRYLDLMAQEKKPAYAENLAIAKREMGELAIKAGSYADASHYFDKSNAHWQEVSRLDINRRLAAAIEINSNSLEIVKCHFALGYRDEALKGANDVATQFLALQTSYSSEDKVVGGLAKVFAFLGSVYEDGGDLEKALKSYQQASDLFADAVRRNSAVDDYRLGLGDCLARVGLLKNDTAKLKGAADILASVVARNHDKPMYLKTLADVYGVLASHQRDGGKLRNAIAFEEQAISLLKPAVQGDHVPLELIHAYSQRLVHLAELRVDDGKFDDSRLPLKDAIEALTQISQANGAQPAFRRTLAKARGLAGFASLKSGDRSSARKYYELASADWTTYLAANPSDGDAARSARSITDQLNKLK